MPGAAQRQEAFESNLATVRSQHAEEMRTYAAEVRELKQAYAAGPGPLEGYEGVVAEMVAQRDAHLEAGARSRIAFEAEVAGEREGTRAALAKLRSEMSQNEELTDEGRKLREDEIWAAEQLEESREEVDDLRRSVRALNKKLNGSARAMEKLREEHENSTSGVSSEEQTEEDTRRLAVCRAAGTAEIK